MGGDGLRLANAEALAEPWPLKGALGYFEWDQIERHQSAVQAPLPWMKAWPDRYHPYSKAPGGIIKPAPAPLFDDLPLPELGKHPKP